MVYTGGAPAKSDSGWLTYDASSKPTLHDGERIAYYSIDAAAPAGNEEAVQHSLALSVDTAAPGTTDDVPAAVPNGNPHATVSAVSKGADGSRSTHVLGHNLGRPANSDSGRR